MAPDRAVDVRRVAEHLDGILSDVARGLEWIVTDHGRPVARSGPAGMADAAVREPLRRPGVLGPRPRDWRIPEPVPLAGGLAQALLQQDRGE